MIRGFLIYHLDIVQAQMSVVGYTRGIARGIIRLWSQDGQVTCMPVYVSVIRPGHHTEHQLFLVMEQWKPHVLPGCHVTRVSRLVKETRGSGITMFICGSIFSGAVNPGEICFTSSMIYQLRRKHS